MCYAEKWKWKNNLKEDFTTWIMVAALKEWKQTCLMCFAVL